MSKKFLLYIFVCVFMLNGCAPQVSVCKHICPGKKSTSQSLNTLRSASVNIISFEAKGQCRAKFYCDGKKYEENFPLRLWVNPPEQIRLHGDIFFNPRGIDLGLNKDEFWLAIKPKEINTYHWGRWSQQDGGVNLLIDPAILTEALGIKQIDYQGSWSLANQGAFDVLTKRTQQGRLIKRLYIDSCNYRISKIEHFDTDGGVLVVVELDKYKEISSGVFVPGTIKIITRSQDNEEDTVRITLRSIKAKKFDKEKEDILFSRPEPKRIKHIYKIINGLAIEQ